MIGTFAVVSVSAFLIFWISRRRITEATKLAYKRTEENDAIVSSCPSFHRSYSPSFVLGNGLIHTFISAFRRPPPDVGLKLRRIHIDARDGTKLALDWYIPGSHVERHQPTILMLHGLSGSASAFYIQWMMWKAHTNGFQCCALNNRGCGESSLTNPKGFNAAFTGDIADTVKYIRETEIALGTPLYIIGFSLGGGLLMKYLSEQGENITAKVQAAVAICASFNMHVSFRNINRPFSMKNRIINRVLTRGLVEYAKRHEHVIRTAEHINVTKVYKSVTIRQFDESYVIPVHGFKDVDHYYDECSTDSRLHLIQVPLLCIHSADDPICPAAGIPLEAFDKHENLMLALVPTGGHVGFLQNAIDPSHSLMESMCIEYFSAIQNRVLRKSAGEVAA